VEAVITITTRPARGDADGSPSMWKFVERFPQRCARDVEEDAELSTRTFCIFRRELSHLPRPSYGGQPRATFLKRLSRVNKPPTIIPHGNYRRARSSATTIGCGISSAAPGT